jgi:hypothetical protein
VQFFLGVVRRAPQKGLENVPKKGCAAVHAFFSKGMSVKTTFLDNFQIRWMP